MRVLKTLAIQLKLFNETTNILIFIGAVQPAHIPKYFIQKAGRLWAVKAEKAEKGKSQKRH